LFFKKRKTFLVASMRKVLVANRSEVACRIFQTCREMGFQTVAVVAPGDEQSRHVTYADEIQRVSSYLEIDALLKAAKRSGAFYIHPGYGFLSESFLFAEAVEKACLCFIGPRSETIRKMADKVEAKLFVQKLGIPVLPFVVVRPGEDLSQAAQGLGYPLLVKACVGGGGRGIRRVETSNEDLLGLAASASTEASWAFGESSFFLERLLRPARHLEVQIFGDGRGGVWHFGERECSLQRRHQKIWEEAPASSLREETRALLLDASLKIGQAMAYRGVGTLEFLVDASEQYYFLEMNTRLQVEHAVTEQVSGVDLVGLQMAQALSSLILVESVQPRGHAIEVRLCAEDASSGFIPTSGSIEVLSFPTGAGIRVESGVECGQLIDARFDSLLAKIIVHAPSRSHALARLRFALEETVLLGIKTNQNYLRVLLEDPQVQLGRVHTSFLDEFSYTEVLPQKEDLELLCSFPTQKPEVFSKNPSPWFHSESRRFV